MQINKIEITQFRNLTSLSFSPSPSLTVVSGSNGSGKSSILEAICYLATGNSFRTTRLSNIISQDFDCFTLFAEISNSAAHTIGIKRCRDLNHKTRIDGCDIYRRSDLVQQLPLQVISPESISLLLDGSEGRRNFIDWALFHVEHSFYYHLSNYSRALKQRNALLKSMNLSELSYWDPLLLEHGEVITRLRQSYVDSIYPLFNEYIERLLPGLLVSLDYRCGHTSVLTFGESLSASREIDIKLKHSTVGPHRADLSVKTEGSKAVDILSRGQLKLVVIALKLAQISHLRSVTSKTPIILIDDLAAELDIAHRHLLMETVNIFGGQLIVTTPDIALIDCQEWPEKKMFHVERGLIKEVV
jgi:DNA replication and repair protein RecF